jgi:hypothetical protein
LEVGFDFLIVLGQAFLFLPLFDFREEEVVHFDRVCLLVGAYVVTLDDLRLDVEQFEIGRQTPFLEPGPRLLLLLPFFHALTALRLSAMRRPRPTRPTLVHKRVHVQHLRELDVIVKLHALHRLVVDVKPLEMQLQDIGQLLQLLPLKRISFPLTAITGVPIIPLQFLCP